MSVSVLDVVNVVATVTSVVLYLSPAPEFHRIHKAQSTGEVAVLPIVVLFVNATMWSTYGALSAAYFPVMVVNVFGVLTTIAFTSVFYRWTAERPRVARVVLAALLFLCLVAIYIILAKTGAVHQSNDDVVNVIGYISVAVNIAMYAAPLATMRTVVRTRSVASLPIALSTVSLTNGALWVAYAALANDTFVLIPNTIGVVLAAAQVALYLKFRHVVAPAASPVLDTADLKLRANSLAVSPLVGSVAIDIVSPTVAGFEPMQSAK